VASKSRATNLKRMARDRSMGKGRKAKLRAEGSTKSKAELFGDKK
jgi:hypothetical protein